MNDDFDMPENRRLREIDDSTYLGPNDEDEHDQTLELFRRLVETRDTEFKESQPFPVLKWKLVRTCMAMANLADGGRIVIGISERSTFPTATGMLPDHEETYNQDDLYSFVNQYARPPVSLTLRPVEFDGKRFLLIEVSPFDRTPIFCKKNMPDEAGGSQLRIGQLMARTRDTISTSKAAEPDLVAEIFTIAAEKVAREIIAQSQRVGFRLPDDSKTRFERERDEFGL